MRFSVPLNTRVSPTRLSPQRMGTKITVNMINPAKKVLIKVFIILLYSVSGNVELLPGRRAGALHEISAS